MQDNAYNAKLSLFIQTQDVQSFPPNLLCAQIRDTENGTHSSYGCLVTLLVLVLVCASLMTCLLSCKDPILMLTADIIPLKSSANLRYVLILVCAASNKFWEVQFH